MSLHELDDSYGTCVETYATLRIFSDDLSPSEITKIIGLEPTTSFQKGEIRTTSPKAKNPFFRTNGWLFCTRSACVSRDSRRHLNYLLDYPLRDRQVTSVLQERRCWFDISVFYAYIGGGPTISPDQMRGLAEAGIDVWWDLYRADNEKTRDSEV
jgi:hypothetical protein